MSFGYAVGDILAILNLFERVAIEIRNYRDAPNHFQHLSAELDLLRSAIKQVFALKPSNLEECILLDRIRAIAMHCQQPVQAFVDKMHTKEHGLGHFRSSRNLSSIGTRIHWSLINRNDVGDLRSVILSQLLAINVLLSSKQLQQMGPRLHAQFVALSNNSAETAKQLALVRSAVEQTPLVISGLGEVFRKTENEQTTFLQSLAQRMDALGKGVKEVTVPLKKLKHQLGDFMRLLLNIRKLLHMLLGCSRRVLNEIIRNSNTLLCLRTQMQQIIRSVEAMPLHISLPIIRFDDALGESWALPFQACGDWKTFQNTLQVLVFQNDRPGASQVAKGLYAITSAKTGHHIPPARWSRELKAGMHIQQAIIVPESYSNKHTCPTRGCEGILTDGFQQNDERNCLYCGFSSTKRMEHESLLHLHTKLALDNPVDSSVTSSPVSLNSPVLESLPSISRVQEELLTFRRVQIRKKTRPVMSPQEALEVLQKEPDDFRANQYMGWSLLSEGLVQKALLHLNKSAERNAMDDGQTEYLLGRAYTQLFIDNPENSQLLQCAFESFRDAVACDKHCPAFWLSLGVLYYIIGQYEDSMAAIGNCKEGNPNVWEAWYNLSLLHRINGHDEDAIKAYDKCLGLRKCLDLSPDTFSRAKKQEFHPLVSTTVTTTEQARPFPRGMIDILLSSVSLFALRHEPASMYVCCQCQDGPKVYRCQPVCVVCNHNVCSTCTFVR